VLQNITAEDEHLGILGPRIMCEVGDTVRVVFRNNLAMPSQIVPRGLQYPASDVTLAIPPGGTHTYVYVLCAMLTAVGGWWLACGALSHTIDRTAGKCRCALVLDLMTHRRSAGCTAPSSLYVAVHTRRLPRPMRIWY